MQDKASSSKFTITAFNQIVRQLVPSLFPSTEQQGDSVTAVTVDELKLALLDIEELAILCDTRKNIVLELLSG